MTKSNKKITILVSIPVAVSAILYSLADRYLIQHIEVSNVSAYTGEVQTSAQPTVFIPGNTALTTPIPAVESTPTQQPATAETSTQTVFSDDWNYQGDGISISIQEVTTGTGNDAVTYFVSDVLLNDATRLQNAFANDSFGRNIIDKTSTNAGQNEALFAVNGDYYGFRSDGIIIRNGVIYRDEPARTGLALYRDGSMQVYDETQTSAQELLDSGVWNTLSFGPTLVENGELINNEGRINIDTNVGNHPVSGNQPRTGIGIIDTNHFVFVVVDGRSKGYSRGVSLNEFAQIFVDLGCTTAYNLDGGGSSTMYFQGRVVNNPLGRDRERGTSDILFIGVSDGNPL